MAEQSFNKSTDPSSLVNIDSPDDFLYEGQTDSTDTTGTKKAKRLAKRAGEFSRVDNPDDIDANLSKK